MQPYVYQHKTLQYKGKTIFSKIIIGNYKRILKLFQDDEACFMFIDNGSFCMRTPDKIIQFNSGDGMLAKCGNYYFENKLENNQPEKKTILIAAYFYPTIIKELFNDNITSSIYKTDYHANKIKVDKLLSNFKDSIDFLLENPEIADENLTLTKLKEFIILLAKTEKAPSVTDFISSLFKPIELNFISIINKHLYSSLSLTELANLCDVSLSTFKRKFEEFYSESPRKYITKKKMDKAIKMLSIKENRITDIAFDCGFDSLSTFTNNFQKYYKKSPSKFRNSLLEPK